MKRTLMYALGIAALAAVYAIAARFGLALQFLDSGATPVWPPTGIAIATLLLAGMRYWPGVSLGAFIANMMNDAGAGTAAGIAVGNTLEAVAGVWLTNHFCNGRNVLERPADIFKYVLLVGGMSTAISATIGATSVCLGGTGQWENYGAIWLTWWLGDAVSALTVVPFIVTWLVRPFPARRVPALIEAGVLIAATIVIGQAVFGGWVAASAHNHPLGYVMLPLLLWGAYRFGLHGAITVSILIAVLAISGTLRSFGPFAVADPNTSLVLMQGFIGTVTASALVLASAEAGRLKSNAALQASAADFQAMANASPAILWTAAPDGTITWASDHWFAYTGIPRDQNARDWPQLLHPDDRERCLRAWNEALAEGTDYEIEVRNRRHDGEYRWFVTRATPMRDEAGAVTGWFGSTTDVHEQKTAEQASARLASIVTSSDDAIISKTLEGIITSWNEGAERLFGYTAAEAVGRPITMLIPPERLEEEADILGRLRRGERIRNYETVRVRRDGLRIDVSLTVSPLFDRDGKPVGASKVARDISERKRTEEELLHHRDHLEQLVQERTTQLEKSHEALRLSERMAALGTLAAGLGHDMGNLLLPIKARLDVLQHSELPGEAPQHLAAIAQCANYLQALTRGLRLFARDPQQDAGNEATVAHTWLEEVAPFFGSVLSRDITFRTQIEPDLPALGIAAHALTQAVLNLVNNAKDALAGRGGEVTLIVAAEAAGPGGKGEATQGEGAEGGARVRITVRDTGPGMPPEVRARAVEPFFTTKARGISTGLGLSLVHGIISAVGGEIVIESEIGRGTAVSLIVSAAVRRRLTDQQRGDGGAAVISVGDARQSALLRAILESLGYEPRATPAAALASAPGDAADSAPAAEALGRELERALDDALIWFTEAHADRLASAQRFLAGDPRRRVIVIGAATPQWTAIGAQSIPGRCNLATVRAALGARRMAPVESGR